MIRRFAITAVFAVAAILMAQSAEAQTHAYGATWGGNNTSGNMERFYHYPYVTYPHNYYGNNYMRSSCTIAIQKRCVFRSTTRLGTITTQAAADITGVISL